MNPLVLNALDVKTAVAGKKRSESVVEAISWPKGLNPDSRENTVVYADNNYQVILTKPGKEAADDYNRCRYKDGRIGNNPNDMRPEILLNGSKFGANATFKDVFYELQVLHSKSQKGLELLGYLLGRSAYMADHVEISPGIWRYSPPNSVIEELRNNIDMIYGVPPLVFLHYLNALALNEDVKYFTLGYDITKDTGRRNNLLTCVNLIGVFLDKVSIVDFAGSFSRPPSGISAISQRKMREIFPLLNEL
jgi:hypothetical protein